MIVTTTLLRLWRPMVLWFAAILVAVQIAAVIGILSVNPMNFSFWLVVAGAAAKYWPLVAGIVLISAFFRTFVTNGITRREFLAGLAVFGLAITLVFPAVVVLGHAVESVVLGLLDQRAASYPVFRVGSAATEYLHVLPGTAAYLTSGILISAGFYRFRPWVGVLLIVPGAVPVVVTDGLIDVDEFGALTQRPPFVLALVLSLAAIGAGCLAAHRVLRDVAIRRTAG